MSDSKRANIRYGGDGSRDLVIDGYLTHFRERNPNASVARELKRLLCIAIVKEQGKSFLGQALEMSVSADKTVNKKSTRRAAEPSTGVRAIAPEAKPKDGQSENSPKSASKVPEIKIKI